MKLAQTTRIVSAERIGRIINCLSLRTIRPDCVISRQLLANRSIGVPPLRPRPPALSPRLQRGPETSRRAGRIARRQNPRADGDALEPRRDDVADVLVRDAADR